MGIEEKKRQETERKRKQRQRLKEEGGKHYQTRITGDQMKLIEAMAKFLKVPVGGLIRESFSQALYNSCFISVQAMQAALEAEEREEPLDDMAIYLSEQINYQPPTFDEWIKARGIKEC